MKAQVRTASVITGVCVLLTGCAGGTVSTDVLRTSSLAISHESAVYPLNPVDTYARIARGAKTCWLGPGKPLAGTHIFHADVPPNGQTAEIALHVKSVGQQSPRAQRAFVVSIVASGQGATVTSDNRRLQGPMAEAMKADITRWARVDVPTCSEAMDATAIAALPVPPLPVRKPQRKATAAKRK